MDRRHLILFLTLICAGGLIVLTGCGGSGTSPGIAPEFAVSPESGDTSTVFEFDASASATTTGLEFRWDWDGNGLFDTAWSSTAIATHQYGMVGQQKVILEVRGAGGRSGQCTATVQVDPEANAFAVADVANTDLNGQGNAAQVAEGNEFTGAFDCALYDAGSFAGSSHSVVIGLRDAAGNWIGGEPVVPASLLAKDGSRDGTAYPGCQFTVSTGAVTPGTVCTVWLHDEPTGDAPTAVQAFKDAQPVAPSDADKPIGTVTIQAAADIYAIGDISDIHLVAGQDPATAQVDTRQLPSLTVVPGQTVSGRFDCKLYSAGQMSAFSHTVAVGFRNTSGLKAGPDPVIVSSLANRPGSPSGTAYDDNEFGPLATDALAVGTTYNVWLMTIPDSSMDAVRYHFGNESPQQDNSTNKMIGTVTITAPAADWFAIENIASVQLNGNGSSAEVNAGQNVTGSFACELFGTGTFAASTHTVVVGLRDDTGAWVGGEPMVCLSDEPGATDGRLIGALLSVSTAGVTGGSTYALWVLDEPNATDASAVQEFKDTYPTEANDTAKPIGNVTVNTAPDLFAIDGIANVNAEKVLSAQLYPPEDPTGFVYLAVDPGDSFSGTLDCKLYSSGSFAGTPHTVVVGLRDSRGYWVGQDPVVCAQLTNAAGSVAGTPYVNVPFGPISTEGCGGRTYYIWVHDAPTSSPHEAINQFKLTTAFGLDPRNKQIGRLAITGGG